MTDNALRNIFIVGTMLFMIILGAMTVNTLRQVANVRTPHLTDAVVAGKQVWQTRNCNDCHTILGIGGYYAPDLTKVIARRGPLWTESWLASPQAMKPDTTMPDQHLTREQVKDLVAFMSWVNGVDTNDWPPKPLVGAPATSDATGGASTGPRGAAAAAPPEVAALVQKGACGTCHTIPGVPGAVGTNAPSWCTVESNLQAGRIDRAYIGRAITDPNADVPAGYKPNVMPQIYKSVYTGQEVDTLVAFIAGLNCGRP